MTTNRTRTPQRTNTRLDEYLPLSDAAMIYHVSVDTLRRRIIDGSLPAVRSGRRIIRVNTTDLERLFRPVQSARSILGG